jgi:hypothetical protein
LCGVNAGVPARTGMLMASAATAQEAANQAHAGARPRARRAAGCVSLWTDCESVEGGSGGRKRRAGRTRTSMFGPPGRGPSGRGAR